MLKYHIQIEVHDDTATTEFVMFDNEVEEIVKKPASKLVDELVEVCGISLYVITLVHA